MNPVDTPQPGQGTFPTFVSVTLIDSISIIVLAIIIIGVLWKYSRWRKYAPPHFFGSVRASLGSGALVGAFFSELVSRVLLQRGVINNDKLRRFTHLSMFWGFIGLSVTTTLDYIYNRPGNYISLFGGALSPIRWLGNISGGVMVLGGTIAIIRLIVVPQFRRGRTFGDVWFTVLLFLAGVTGFIAEYWGDVAYAANPSIAPAATYSLSFSASLLIVVPYGIHLASIALLLVTAPVSAFIHAFQVPTMRYSEKLGSMLSLKTGLTTKNEQRRFKETAMLDQIQEAYEGTSGGTEEKDK